MDAADIIEIHQLLGRYGHALDHQRWDELAGLFLADAVLDYTRAGAPEVFRGAPAIVDWFRGVTHPSAHHVTNIVATADGPDRAVVDSKFLVPYTRPAHHPQRLAGGDYHDTVVRTSAGWRFAEKVCIKRWQLTPGDQTGLGPRHATF